jgi:hypothetical protein
MEGLIRYFAYGSNMSLLRLRQRVPAARPLGSAILRGHDLRFHKRGRDGSGKCDAFQVSDPGIQLIGALYDIPLSGKTDLDRIEGLGAGYEEKMVPVLDPGGSWHEAVTYFATDIHDGLQPYCWYKHHVLTGARELELPASYIAKIEAVAMVPDSDNERRTREHAAYL